MLLFHVLLKVKEYIEQEDSFYTLQSKTTLRLAVTILNLIHPMIMANPLHAAFAIPITIGLRIVHILLHIPSTIEEEIRDTEFQEDPDLDQVVFITNNYD